VWYSTSPPLQRRSIVRLPSPVICRQRVSSSTTHARPVISHLRLYPEISPIAADSMDRIDVEPPYDTNPLLWLCRHGRGMSNCRLTARAWHVPLPITLSCAMGLVRCEVGRHVLCPLYSFNIPSGDSSCVRLGSRP
jgi:hypothetical protein